MSEQLVDIGEKIGGMRNRARAEFIIKIYIRIYMRQAARAFSKWHFQTDMRKAVGNLDRRLAESGLLSKEREMYNKVKLIVDSIADKYNTSMAQIVVRNIKEEPNQVVVLLGDETQKMVMELIDKL